MGELLRATMSKLGWLEDKSGGLPYDDDPESGGSTPSQTHGGAPHMWNLLWTWSSRVHVPDSELFVWQRVNHFAECRCAPLEVHFCQSALGGTALAAAPLDGLWASRAGRHAGT